MPPSPNTSPATRYAGIGLTPMRSDSRARTARPSAIAPSSMNARATSCDVAARITAGPLSPADLRRELLEAFGRAHRDGGVSGGEHVVRTRRGDRMVLADQG